MDRAATETPNRSVVVLLICTLIGIAAPRARVPREIEPTILIDSETARFNFGLQLAASGSLLAVEDRVLVGNDTEFQFRIGRARNGAWHEEARFPSNGWVLGQALTKDTFVWHTAGAGGGVRFARYANGRWTLAETLDVDDDRCRYAPSIGKNIFLEDNVLVVNGATGVCVFERRGSAWTIAQTFPKSEERELVVYAGGRLISAVVEGRTVVVHTRDKRRWKRSEITLPFQIGFEGLAASRHDLALKKLFARDVFVIDLDRGAITADIKPPEPDGSFGTFFAIDDDRLLIDDFYRGPYLYVQSRGHWRLDAKLKAEGTLGVALGDVAWVTLFRFGSEEPGRVAGFIP